MNAPKLTPEHVASQVVGVAYHRFPGTTVTVCCITLRNGYNTIGHSACVSAENFDQVIGEQIAYKNALNEIWQLEGYLLREFLWLESLPPAPVLVPEGGGIAPAPHGHTAFAAAPQINDERLEQPSWNYAVAPSPVLPPSWGNSDGPAMQSGGGGDYAGAGASGSWEAATPSACPAPAPSDPPAASAGDSCSSYDNGSGI